MNHIVACIWFDHNAQEAVDFYADAFPDLEITDVQRYASEGLPDFQLEFAGLPLTIEFTIRGQRFVALNAGPEFPINTSVSFMLNFDPSVDDDARRHLDETWAALCDGGTVLMPLDRYPFSERYGWVQDRYGVSWQLILTDPAGEPRPFVLPCLLFGAGAQNRAEEAIGFYTEVFDGRVGTLVRNEQQHGPATPGSVSFSDFTLRDQWFVAMDAASEQAESFSFGVSFIVECEDQEELDSYWALLSAVPELEQCGWCVDRFGLGWQVVPVNLNELMTSPGGWQKLLAMRKIEISGFA